MRDSRLFPGVRGRLAEGVDSPLAGRAVIVDGYPDVGGVVRVRAVRALRGRVAVDDVPAEKVLTAP